MAGGNFGGKVNCAAGCGARSGNPDFGREPFRRTGAAYLPLSEDDVIKVRREKARAIRAQNRVA